MNYLEIKQDLVGIKIGQPTNGHVNVMVNFNIMKHLQFVDALDNSPSVAKVDQVASYDDESSGIALTLKPGADIQSLQSNIEHILKNYDSNY